MNCQLNIEEQKKILAKTNGEKAKGEKTKAWKPLGKTQDKYIQNVEHTLLITMKKSKKDKGKKENAKYDTKTSAGSKGEGDQGGNQS